MPQCRHRLSFNSISYCSFFSVFRAEGQGIVNFNNRAVVNDPTVDAKLYDDYWEQLIPLSGTDTSYRGRVAGWSDVGHFGDCDHSGDFDFACESDDRQNLGPLLERVR